MLSILRKKKIQFVESKDVKVVKKILFFTPSLRAGGIERVFTCYANGLSNKGYEVSYAVMYHEPNEGSFIDELQPSIKFINLRTFRMRKSIIALARLFCYNTPDVVVVANEPTISIVFAKLFSRRKFKIISSQHSFIENAETNASRSYKLIRFSSIFCHKIFAVSDGIALMLREKAKINSKKVVTIYNPINKNRIISLSNLSCGIYGEYILFVGRFSLVKNLPLLINSYCLFAKRYNGIKLLLVGDGLEKQNVMTLCDMLGISDRVVLCGEQSNPYPFICNAKIVALPSFSESLSLVIIESLLLGKTVVATPTYGAKDVLCNGKYGYISQSFDNVEEFASLLEQAYHNPLDSSLLTMATNRYDVQTKVEELEALWK